MKNIFSKNLYFQGLKNLKTVGIGCLVALAVINGLIAFATAWEESTQTYSNTVYIDGGEQVLKQESQLIEGGAVAPLAPLIMAIGLLIVSSTFSFLNKRADSDFYHSMPQKRICVYISFLLSAITWICFILILTLSINGLIWTISDAHHISWSSLLPLFAGYLASSLVIAGIFVTIRMVSGTEISTAAYVICAIFVPRAIILIVEEFIKELNRSIYFPNTWFRFFGFDKSAFSVLSTMFEDSMEYFHNAKHICFLFAEALIFFVIGAILFAKRKSELAGKNTAHRIIHGIFRTLAVLPLLLVMFTLSEDFLSVVIFFMMSLMHFLFDLILTKNAKTSAKSLPFFFVALGVALTITIASVFGNSLFISSNPKANQIQAVSITVNGDKFNGFRNSNSENYSIYSPDVLPYVHADLWTDDEEAIKTVAQALLVSDQSEKYGENRYCINLKLKNGKEITRLIKFTYDELLCLVAAIKGEEENASSLTMPQFEELTLKACGFYRYSSDKTYTIPKEMYDCFLKEYQALSPAEKADCECDQMGDNLFVFNLSTENKSYVFYLHQKYFPKTLELYNKLIPLTFSQI